MWFFNTARADFDNRGVWEGVGGEGLYVVTVLFSQARHVVWCFSLLPFDILSLESNR